MKIPDFRLERYFAKHEFTARYLLSSSDSESFSVSELLALEAGSEDQFRKLWLGYTESLGHPALRMEIAKIYQNISSENILVHAGAQEAIFNFMNVLLRPGDRVIVQSPSYQSLAEIARSIGCEVVSWPMTHENKWEPDINFLEKNLTAKTKLVVINTPHNPTGHLFHPNVFHELIEMLREREIFLFSDEVYRLSEYKRADRLPAVCDIYELGTSLGVMSKSYGLAGLRIGWVATRNKNILERMASFKDYTSICCSAPSEFLATLALKHTDRILERNKSIAQNNLRILRDFFQRTKNHLEWVEPRAGVIAFPRFRNEIKAEDFAEDLVKKRGVMILPGKFMDYDSRHFRIGFGRKNFSDVLRIFEEHFLASL